MVSKGTLAWSNIVAALGGAIVSTLITAWYFRGSAAPKPSVPSGFAGALTGLGQLATETITYIPHILLLFGVLADMFTMEGVYSIPSLIALISLPLNYLMKYFWDGLGSLWVSILQLYNTKPSDQTASKGLFSGIKNPFASKPAAAPAAALPSAAAPAAALPPVSPGNPFAPGAAAAPKPAGPKPAGPKPAGPNAPVKNPLAPILPKQSKTGNIPTYNATLLPEPGAGTGLMSARQLAQYQSTRGKPGNILLQKTARKTGGSIEKYDGCDVQGFSALHNKYAPQSLVITATVFMYYIFDLIINRGWVDATAPIVVFAVVYAAETFIIGNCKLDSDGESFSTGVKSLISFIHGLIFGGTAYGVVSSYYPKSLPSRVLPDFPRKTAADLTRREDGTYVDENNSPWVILPNGNAIPAMSAGTTAADETSTSTGSSATPGSCPGGNC